MPDPTTIERLQEVLAMLPRCAQNPASMNYVDYTNRVEFHLLLDGYGVWVRYMLLDGTWTVQRQCRPCDGHSMWTWEEPTRRIATSDLPTKLKELGVCDD